MKAIQNAAYASSNGNSTVHIATTKEEVEPDVAATAMHRASTSDFDRPLSPPRCAPRQTDAAVTVDEMDCVELASELRKRYPNENVAMLNLASGTQPGGGWFEGAGAQEENLFRRSNCCQHLDLQHYAKWFLGRRDWSYPLPPLSALHSQNVIFFRGSEASGYPFLDEPELFDVISVAAARCPNLVVDGNDRVQYADAGVRELMRCKIELMLWTAAQHGDGAIVLGAFGCGAYGNPPDRVAEMFEAEIKKYRRYFAAIAFGIFDDHNSRKAHNSRGNLIPFQEMAARVNAPVDYSYATVRPRDRTPPPAFPAVPQEHEAPAASQIAAHDWFMHITAVSEREFVAERVITTGLLPSGKFCSLSGRLCSSAGPRFSRSPFRSQACQVLLR